MSSNSIIIYLACLILIFIVGKIFFLPIKKIIKLLINSVLGGFIIYIVNIIGSAFNFHIGLNIFTAIFVGILGVPRSCFVSFNKYNILNLIENEILILFDLLFIIFI